MPGGKGKLRPEDNPKPFKKGQIGNPNGRPKKLPQLDKLLIDVLGSVDDDTSPAHDILLALEKKAKGGDVRAAEVLLDRAYGKAKQFLEFKFKGNVSTASIDFSKLTPEEGKLYLELKRKAKVNPENDV